MVNNNKLRTLFKDMSDYRITLKSVYSCPASETPADVKLPEGWSLSWHQLETGKAIHDPNIDVIFNTAMTGDGKILAAYLETLLTDLLGSELT
jgi:CRISPR-associated endonuclease/helicase Cas3